MADYVFSSTMLLLLTLNPSTVSPKSPWAKSHSDWWFDTGTDWEVSNTLRQRSPLYSTYGQLNSQMNQWAPALHYGKINRGYLPNRAKYRPRDRGYGENPDFNQRDLRKGVFKKVPKVPEDFEWVEADSADVDAGLAKCVGDMFKLPNTVTVMEDGSYTVETPYKQNPCAGNPCQKLGAYRKSYCSKEEDFIARCDPRNGPFQLDLVWTTGKNLDIRVIAIDAATGDVLGDGAGRNEIFHKTAGGAYGAIVPVNKKKGPGTETLLLKTLADDSDYKDYVYVITVKRTNKNKEELQDTGARLVVRYGGVVVKTFPVPQGAGVNPPNRKGKYKRRYLFGCFKPGRDGHYLHDFSVARFEWGGTNGKARMAELCRPRPSEMC